MISYFTSMDEYIRNLAEMVLAAHGTPVHVKVEKGTIYLPIEVSRDIRTEIEVATGWTKIVVKKE